MYQLREVTLTNNSRERKVLVIEFTDPQKAIIAEFLMSDAHLLQGKVVRDIDTVLSGKRDYLKSTGNRCALEITRETTQITDLFANINEDFTALDSYNISTSKLRGLIVMWLAELAKFKEKNN